ncbi:hypothetical protein BGZ98_001275, partial [Dissophora globulifera]
PSHASTYPSAVLIVKRSVLYSPALAYQIVLERIQQHWVCLPSEHDLNIGAWYGSGVLVTASWQVVAELERLLQLRAFESIERQNMGLQGYQYVYGVLNGFYSSRTFKKMKWERQKQFELRWT